MNSEQRGYKDERVRPVVQFVVIMNIQNNSLAEAPSEIHVSSKTTCRKRGRVSHSQPLIAQEWSVPLTEQK